jgi:hypothetical protein
VDSPVAGMGGIPFSEPHISGFPQMVGLSLCSTWLESQLEHSAFRVKSEIALITPVWKFAESAQHNPLKGFPDPERRLREARFSR